MIDQNGLPVAFIGQRQPRTVRLGLREGGDRLGDLLIAAPRDAAGSRIAAALVPHVATVVRSERLAVELQAERERVVRATIAERERIRSDLHDGLGPSLSGISLGLQAANSAMGGDPSAVQEILRRTRQEADAAVREVRRVLDALRACALDRQDLASAIRETAQRLGLGRGDGPSFTGCW